MFRYGASYVSVEADRLTFLYLALSGSFEWGQCTEDTMYRRPSDDVSIRDSVFIGRWVQLLGNMTS